MEDQRAGKSPIDAFAEAAKTDPEIMPALWEAVERFIKYQARRRFVLVGNFGGCELEDLTQSGYLALVEAVEDYDPERGSFISILTLHLKTAFAEAAGIRSAKRDALLYADSLNMPLYEEEQDGNERIDALSDPAAAAAFRNAENRVFTKDLHRALQTALDALSPKKREIIKARYYDGLRREEIGRQIGCSGSAVRDQEREALKQMRQQAKITGLAQFVEIHTVYYRHYGVEYMKRTQTSPVEALVLTRERLRELWEQEKRYTVII